MSYLIESKRRPGWKEDPKDAQAVKDNVSNSKGLNEIVKELRNLAKSKEREGGGGGGGGRG